MTGPYPPGSAAGMAPDDTSGLIEIRPSNIGEMREMSERQELFEEHYQELATDKGLMRLSPNWKRYYALEEQDMVSVIAAWLGDEMVGYSVNLTFHHMHYADLKVMQNDVLFVTKDHRHTGAGLKLIEATEEMGRAMECGMVLFHSKLDTSLGLILEARGYQVQDVIQSKAL